MKINEDIILESYQNVYSLLSNPSYSKYKHFEDDINQLNTLYCENFGKYVSFDIHCNPYYDRLFNREENKTLLDFISNIVSYSSYYTEIARNYLNILKENNFFESYPSCNQTYTSDEIKKLLLDFFNEQGHDKYKIINSMLEEGRVSKISYQKGDNAGFCTILTSNLKPFVTTKRGKYDLYLSSVLAHEFGHAIEAHYILNRTNNFYSYKTRILSEVSSCFYEIEFLRYLQRNRINNSEVNSLINYYHTFSNVYLSSLLILDCKEYYHENEKYLITGVFEIDDKLEIILECSKENDGSIHRFAFPLMHPLKYGLGTYIALHLSEIRKQNPNEFNKKMNDFLSMRTLMEYDSIMEIFEINIIEFLSGDLIKGTIEKDLDNYRKQLKIKL